MPVTAIRDTVLDLPASRIREVASLGSGPGMDDVIGLWFGEPDQPTPDFIREAGAKALLDGDTFYTPNRGVPRLRHDIAAYMSALYGLPISDDWVTVTASGMNAVQVALQTLLGPGDKLVTTSPLWPNLPAVARICNADVVEVPLTPGTDGWSLDVDKFLNSCGDDTRVILLNSPNNPTGWTATDDDLSQVLEHARKTGAWVVSDEVYARIVFGRSHAPSLMTHLTEDDKVLVLNSFSKSWAMTGWRLGWITAPPTVGPVLEKMMEFSIAGAPGFVQQAAITALRDGEDFIRQSVARYEANRDTVIQRLHAVDRVTTPTPEAAFYCFFHLDGVNDGVAFAKHLVHEARVGLAPGEAFGLGWPGWLRLCTAATPETLAEALDRLEPFFRRHG